jgi:hypothetical protein
MTIQEQITQYIASQPEPKRAEMLTLHDLILALKPRGDLWFVDGKDESGKTVANPNIGYGQQTLKYANGKTKPFYQVGISANTTGISVYILGLEDTKYLAATYGSQIGKASVTGYCIKFKTLKDVKQEVLVAAIRDGLARNT